MKTLKQTNVWTMLIIISAVLMYMTYNVYQNLLHTPSRRLVITQSAHVNARRSPATNEVDHPCHLYFPPDGPCAQRSVQSVANISSWYLNALPILIPKTSIS